MHVQGVGARRVHGATDVEIARGRSLRIIDFDPGLSQQSFGIRAGEVGDGSSQVHRTGREAGGEV